MSQLSKAGPLSCIAHGDCWNNNILYSYDDRTGKAVDVRLVDWQMVVLADPGRDVYTFLASSTTAAMRKENGKQLIDHYVSCLMSALEKLGLSLADEGFDRQFVTAEVEKSKLFGMISGILYLPIMLDGNWTSQLVDKAKDESVVAARKEDMDPFSEVTGVLTFDSLLANKILCQRLIDLVLETKEAVQ